MRKIKFKKWLLKYSIYLVLAGIVLVSFLAEFLAGALLFHSDAAETEELITLPLPTSDTTAFESAMTPVSLGYSPVKEETEKVEEESEEVVYFDVPLEVELQDYIWFTCQEYDVPYELVFAMIEIESGFQTDVISNTNDYGLMQINKINHEWLAEELGITDILDPYQNILAGTYIIRQHLKATDGNPTLALMCYNCGAAGAEKLWEQGVYSTSYTDKVMAAYENYRQQGVLLGN